MLQATKTKRPRIKPLHTNSVEQRIKKAQNELGLSKFDLIWLKIQNELKTLNTLKNEI